MGTGKWEMGGCGLKCTCVTDKTSSLHISAFIPEILILKSYTYKYPVLF